MSNRRFLETQSEEDHAEFSASTTIYTDLLFIAAYQNPM